MTSSVNKAPATSTKEAPRELYIYFNQPNESADGSWKAVFRLLEAHEGWLPTGYTRWTYISPKQQAGEPAKNVAHQHHQSGKTGGGGKGKGKGKGKEIRNNTATQTATASGAGAAVVPETTNVVSGSNNSLYDALDKKGWDSGRHCGTLWAPEYRAITQKDFRLAREKLGKLGFAQQIGSANVFRTAFGNKAPDATLRELDRVLK